MKFTCELDWVAEDETIDSKIQQMVVEKVVDVVSKKMGKDLFEKIEQEARVRLEKDIDEKSIDLVSKFLDREVAVTDQWGDLVKKYPSATELLKSKFDAFLSATVDKTGVESSRNSYGGKVYTRIEFLLDKQIQEQSKLLTESIASSVGKKIDEIKHQIHVETVEKITKKLGLG